MPAQARRGNMLMLRLCARTIPGWHHGLHRYVLASNQLFRQPKTKYSALFAGKKALKKFQSLVTKSALRSPILATREQDKISIRVESSSMSLNYTILHNLSTLFFERKH
jgi:hypothetical protein